MMMEAAASQISAVLLVAWAEKLNHTFAGVLVAEGVFVPAAL